MKTLVCITAQVRNGNLTWPTFKKHVVDALGADLALCIGDSRPRTLGQLIEGGTADETSGYFTEAKHIWRFDEPTDWSEAYDLMSKDWRMFASIPGGWLGPAKLPVRHGNSGGIVLFFRWFLLQKLRRTSSKNTIRLLSPDLTISGSRITRPLTWTTHGSPMESSTVASATDTSSSRPRWPASSSESVGPSVPNNTDL